MINRDDYRKKPTNSTNARIIEGNIIKRPNLTIKNNDKVSEELLKIFGIGYKKVKDHTYIIDQQEIVVFTSAVKNYQSYNYEEQIKKKNNVTRELQYHATKDMVGKNYLLFALDAEFDNEGHIIFKDSTVVIINNKDRVKNINWSDFNSPSKSSRLSFNNFLRTYENKIEFFEDKQKNKKINTGIMVRLNFASEIKDLIIELINIKDEESFKVSEEEQTRRRLKLSISEDKSYLDKIIDKFISNERSKLSIKYKKSNIYEKSDAILNSYLNREISQAAHIMPVEISKQEIRNLFLENNITDNSGIEEINFILNNEKFMSKLQKILDEISDLENILFLDPTIHFAWDNNLIDINENGEIEINAESKGFNIYSNKKIELTEKNKEFLIRRKK